MPAKSPSVRLAVLAIIAALVVVASAFLGPTRVTWDAVFHPAEGDFFWRLRAPRTALAAAVGAGLSLGGVVCQTLFRNPLATPYTLGIPSAGSLAVALAMLFGVSGQWFFVPRLHLFAFLGCCVAMLLILSLARLPAGRDMTRLLLGGVCLSYAGAAGVMFIHWIGTPAVTAESVKWMMGSLATLRPVAAAEVGLALLVVAALTAAMHRSLDLLAMGESLAAGRGVQVARVTWTCLAGVGLLTAVIVANCGPIGFVGLMIPNVLRGFIGPRTLPLAAASCLLGAAFLAVCDGAARTFESELPVGVITNILGAGFFISLLARRPHASSA